MSPQKNIFDRLRTLFIELESVAGPDPVRRPNGFTTRIVHVQGHREIQVYYPAFSVAGQGTTFNAAFYEALDSLEAILQFALEQRSWSPVPHSDVSLSTRVRLRLSQLSLAFAALVIGWAKRPLLIDAETDLELNQAFDLPCALAC